MTDPTSPTPTDSSLAQAPEARPPAAPARPGGPEEAGGKPPRALVKESTLDSVAGEEDPGASLDMVAPVVPQPGARR